MPVKTLQARPKRRSVNLSIRDDIMREARALHLNASQAAEAGIADEIRKRQEAQWRKENHRAIRAHNKRIERDGPLLTPGWSAKK